MRKRITLLIAALTMALTMSVSGAALASHTGSHFNPQAPQCEKDRGGDNPNCPGPRR